MKINKFSFIQKLIFGVALMLFAFACKQTNDNNLMSPDKHVGIALKLNSDGSPEFSAICHGDSILKNSRLGLIRQDADFSKGLRLTSVSSCEKVDDKYTLMVGKKLSCSYTGNKKVFHFENTEGKKMDIVFQVSNDGIAFRYNFPDESKDTFRITQEITEFNFDDSTKSWIQPMSEAKTGWCSTNPSYEEHYFQGVNVKELPNHTPGWVFPALFKSESVWISITETALTRNYCGCRLKHDSSSVRFNIGFPQTPEFFPGGALNPESTLPWETPWRVITVGKNLATIVESTLSTDLAKPTTYTDLSYIKPGRSSWSWVLYKDDSTVYNVQKRFIDYASDMSWEYCLIDADWDRKIGYDKVKELCAYAKTKNVHVNVWYNSSGSWNTTPYTPRDKMISKDLRDKEFAILKEIGVSGIKVDFFGGDGQSVMAYYLDILEDAARYQLLVNFHGCTLPRSWQRTYPNLVTMESIKGLEFITFVQENADKEPTHCAVIPFTRNLFDPMDFTPVSLIEIPFIQRKTSSAFELALSVIFVSGIQHFGEVPEGMAKVPAEVKQYMKDVPVAWDEIKFVDGYPGKYIVIARRKANTWYVAGINGEKSNREITIDLSFIKNPKETVFIADGETNRTFDIKTNYPDPSQPVKLILKAEGGFASTFKMN